MERVVSVECPSINSKKLERRRYSVYNKAEHGIRVECIIFVQWRRWYLDVVELSRLEVYDVSLWILVQLWPLDEDIGAASKGCIEDTLCRF